MPRRRLSLPLLVLAVVPILAVAGELNVSAAASLGDAFKDLAKRYEAEHAGTRVLLNVGASGALLQQMAHGAPVDVFASADEETMDAAAKQALIVGATRVDFAGNTLVLAVPSDASPAITGLADLASPQVTRIAIGHPASVPAGRYAKRALDAAGLWTALSAKVVFTQNVRQALEYVARGDVDAGFIYATDAKTANHKVTSAFAVTLDMPIRYPIAVTAQASDAAEARRFVAYVRSKAAQDILAGYGFRSP